MKDYTINEAREIITKYFDKISDEHKQNNYGCSCVGIECRDCLFSDKKGDYCNDKIINNEFIAKAEEFINEEFINQVDWSKVAVDTKILVRDYENSDWTKCYFAKCENGKKVEAWCNGGTSWTGAATNYWNYAKLYVEGEDNE